MRPLARLRDPAPSRSAYRLQRLMLTPGFRLFLRAGLPAGILLAVGAAWFSDPEHRTELRDGIAEMRRQIEQRPEFMVTLLSIEGASDDVADDIRDILPLDFPMSSFDLDLEQIRLRAEEIDAVADASARIRSGGVLELRVTEREPAVVWRGREGLELLDGDGHRVAALGNRTERPDLPLLAGDGADAAVAEALSLLAAAGPLDDRLRGLLRVGERRWDVVLDRGQRILLPEAAPIEALERVIALDQVRELLSRDVAFVDMRNPARPTVRMNADAAETFRDATF